ncbi:MAG: hypothetical protein R6U57_04955 [Anaerolineales bacterium]
MMTTQAEHPIPALKWTGLVLGTTAGLFWFLILTLHGIEDIARSATPPAVEGILLSLLILLACASVGVSWKRVKVGGILTMLSGFALSLFAILTAGHNHLIAALISGFLFLLAGMLISLSIWLKKGEG